MGNYELKSIENFGFIYNTPFFIQGKIKLKSERLFFSSEYFKKNLIDENELETMNGNGDILDVICHLLNSEHDRITSECQNIVSTYISNQGQAKELYLEFEKRLKELHPIFCHYSDNLFVYETVVQYSNKVIDDMFYNEEQGKMVITSDNYYNYRKSIFKMLSPTLPYLYDEEMVVLIKDYINDFLIKNITSAVSIADIKMISPFDEITDSLKLLKETIEFIRNRKTDFDIFNTEYLLLSKCKIKYLTKYFETFLPKFLKLNSDFNLKLHEIENGDGFEYKKANKPYYSYTVNRFSEWIFVMMHHLITGNIYIGNCKSCGNYFAPENKRTKYCKVGYIPETKYRCCVYGAQWVRNSEMPSYQLEYEKIVKRFRLYMKRANLLDETIIKKLEVFANSYYKLKADFDNGKFSEEEFIEKLEKEYEINHKNLKTPK